MSDEVLESVRKCPREALPQLIGEAIARLLAAAPAPDKFAVADQLLTTRQASERLNCPKSWLYRAHKTLPFAVHDPARPRWLRFSSRGIEKYISERTNGRKS